MTTSKTNKLIIIAVTIFPICVFIWTYKTTGGNTKNALHATAAASVVTVPVLRWKDAKDRGLSADQMLLADEGPEKVVNMARQGRRFGIFLALTPLMISIAGVFSKHKYPIGFIVFTGLLFGAFCWPFSLFMFKRSKKLHQLASEAN